MTEKLAKQVGSHSPAASDNAVLHTAAEWERERKEHRPTETRLREELASLSALLRQKDDLIEQQNLASKEAEHRMLNDLQIVASVLAAQGRASGNAVIVPEPASQRQIAHALLTARGIARLAELRDAGVTAASMSRMERDGEVLRLARGLYPLSDATLDAHHSLAEAAKRVPKGVVCLVSALAFHELTDQLPRQIWIAIRQKDWPPKANGMPIRWCASLIACSGRGSKPTLSRACP